MTEKISAGLLMYYRINDEVKIFLIHPGGPFFAKKDAGYWGIPKGEPDENEELFEAAKREFKEETGITPAGTYITLGNIVQKGGKRVHAWAFECSSYDEDEVVITCNTFSMEWPPKSGKFQHFAEVDRGCFFTIDEARQKINSAQSEFIDRLLTHLKSDNTQEKS